MDLDLPAGCASRAATIADFAAITALTTACNRDLVGAPDWSLEETQRFWTLPGIELARDTRLVFAPGGELIATELFHPVSPFVQLRVWGNVHPDWRGRGIGAALVRWVEAHTRQWVPRAPHDAQVAVIGFSPAEDECAKALYREHGFSPLREFVRYSVIVNEAPGEIDWPAGITVRPLRLDEEGRAACRAAHEAFRDHWGYVERDEEEGYAEFRHWLTTPPGHDPRFHWLALDGDEIVGLCLCNHAHAGEDDRAYVGLLAVRRPWRRRGIARALLCHAAQAFADAGKRTMSLHADATSLTGANRVYEGAGMRVDRRTVEYEKTLRPGRTLRTE